MTGPELVARYQAAKTRRANYDAALEDCAKYIRPLRLGISGTVTEGQVGNEDVLDSTALDANKKLGSRMTGTLCSQLIRWFGLQVRDARVNADADVRKWFDVAETQMLLAYAQSQFYSEMNEALTDLPGLGTGGIFTDPLPVRPGLRFTGLMFRSVGVGSIAIDESADGLVDEVWREFTLSARAAKAVWKTGLTQKTQELAEDKPGELVTFLHGVFPREGVSPLVKVAVDGTAEPVAATKLPFASFYLEKDAKHIVEESGYHEQPYAIGRWSRPADHIYGRGIGHDAIADIKTLNESRKMFLEQWAIAVRPPLKRTRNVRGPVRWVPGGATEVSRPEDLTEFTTTARFDVANAGIADLRDAVRNMWFDDQLSLRESSRMTTVEVYARLELMQQLLGPNVGRILYEVFNRNIERVFGILLRAKMFPPMPEPLARYFSQVGLWGIEYQSPMARAQRSPELTAIDRTVSAIVTMQPVYPAIVDVLKADEAVRHIAEVAGVPPTLIRTEDELAEVRQARAEEQQRLAQLQETEVISKGLGDASGMVKALQPQNGGQA